LSIGNALPLEFCLQYVGRFGFPIALIWHVVTPQMIKASYM
jgi:hypothetical protein